MWLASLFAERKIAVLSRGHGRNTKGFRKLTDTDNAETTGDEPVLMHRRLGQSVAFYVCEDRMKGASLISESDPDVNLLLLDDAFQHRMIKGDFNLLLTTWSKPYSDDYLVPVGTLRDVRSRANAAHAVIVTKCPPGIIPDLNEWTRKLCLRSEQHLFFSRYTYSAPYELTNSNEHIEPTIKDNVNAIVVTGIARGVDFFDHVRNFHPSAIHVEFPDHHAFTQRDIERTARKFANFAAGSNWLFTTEKDCIRLESFLPTLSEQGIRVSVIQIDVELIGDNKNFKKVIKTYVG